MWSSTEVFSADVNGQIATRAFSSNSYNDSSYKTDISFEKDIQETTLGGLYLVEISRNGEILKQESAFLKPKDKQAITIYI